MTFTEGKDLSAMTIAVEAVDDNYVEGNHEVMILHLPTARMIDGTVATPAGAVSTASVKVSIMDNDEPGLVLGGSVTVTSLGNNPKLTVNEGGNQTITVRLAKPSLLPVTVCFLTELPLQWFGQH